MTSLTLRAPSRRPFRTRTMLGAVAAAFCLTCGIGAVGASSADAFTVPEFSASPSTTQAGGHPDLTVFFRLENHLEPGLGDPCGCNDARDIVAHLPTGLIGNPHAYPRCAAAQFAINSCPVDSQIGVATPDANVGLWLAIPVPLYNLVPQPGQAGLIGFTIPIIGAPIYTVLSARTDSDYGLDARTEEIQRLFPLRSFKQEIWGVPADPSHDDRRWSNYKSGFPQGVPTPSNSPLRPFMQNPITCGVPLTTTLDVRAHNGETTTVESSWPPTTGCGQLSFNPSLSAKPTTTEADTPSGLDVELTVPQTQSPTTPSPSEIRSTIVTLPEGVAINPNAADGKLGCTDSEARFGTLEQARCPEFAKVGTLVVESAVLPGDLPGAIYLGAPQPGNRYRLFLVADGFGVHVKLPGTVTPDPVTGRLRVSFVDLPQFPLEKFSMHFFGSERGLLATPTHCGTYAVDSEFVPWNSELSTQTSVQFFSIASGPGGSPCPGPLRPFRPGFNASSVGNTAGAYSPLWVNLTRRDGDQTLSGLTVTTPPGFSGSLRGIPYCSEAALSTLGNALYSGLAELAAPACPAASKIGTAVTGVGAGSRTLYTPGKVYLAGPYKGAPLSLVVVVPAVSGPYDLGNVAVRAAINVNPVNAQVTTASDPLPQILEGIPLRTRSILVKLDRPGFALNPTNCSRFSTEAKVYGGEGAQSTLRSPYQVANCAILPFGPKLGLKLRGSTKRRGHPALRAVLRAGPGNANLRRAVTTMPNSLLLDNAHIGNVCTRVQFAASNCPPASAIGSATVSLPILDAPLSGPIYLRSSSNKLPDLVADLSGQLDVELSAKIDSTKKGGLRASFNAVPDAPFTKAVLDLQGGGKGLLINGVNLCKARPKAAVRLVGQNGKNVTRRTKLRTSCGSKARHKRRLMHSRVVR